MNPSPVIVWLRRDLRLQDHTALFHALQTGQPVIILFIFDPAILQSRRISAARIQFMLNALISLDENLRQYGTRLLIRHGNPATILAELCQQIDAKQLFFNIDYTPYARRRDETVATALEANGVRIRTFHDRLLQSPDQIATGMGTPYTVYTPFKNKWRSTERNAQPLICDLNPERFYPLADLDTPPVPTLAALGFQPTSIELPPASEVAAHAQLERFTQQSIYSYKDSRNLIANPYDPRNGTSFLSPYIRFGLLSLRQIRAAAAQAYQTADHQSQRDAVITFMDEIIWHEFYTHVLWHFPHVKTRNFNAKYDPVQWRWSANELDAWAQGLTGYPIVDAAMRQLNALGWMHNRARMIIASFLTKDLLIDWRAGELYFMQNLLDGDLAANNGGWQWAAGTGTDAQPYFRIFNPVAQSEKFDPEGAFIRYWLPELRDVPDKYIHTPWLMSLPPKTYPVRIVEHDLARDRALEAFAVVKGKK